MKASNMTNEELAKELIEITGCDSICVCNVCTVVCEAAKRLRNVTVRSDNSAVIAELERRLKVADDAIQDAIDEYCLKCTVSADDRREVCDQCLVCDWKEALTAIREPVTDCNQLKGASDGK